MKTSLVSTAPTWIVAAFIAAATLSMVAAAVPALAVCGDGEVDVGEMCDDGNLADGDCCSSACQRPDYCHATNRSSIIIRDLGDDRADKVFWKYFRGPTTFEEWGDPHETTTYSFCVWDDDELKVDTRVEPGGICHPRRPCWKTLGRGEPTAYRYFNKPSNPWGIQRLQISTSKPPRNGFISLRAIGVDIPLPGPVGFDKYFNQTVAVTAQFHRGDAPICWEAVYTKANKNIFKRYKSLLFANK